MRAGVAGMLVVALFTAAPGAGGVVSIAEHLAGSLKYHVGVGVGGPGPAFVFEAYGFQQPCSAAHLVVEPTGFHAESTAAHGAGPIVRIRAWVEELFDEGMGWAQATAWAPPPGLGDRVAASGMASPWFVLDDAGTRCERAWCSSSTWCFPTVWVRGWGVAWTCRAELPDVLVAACEPDPFQRGPAPTLRPAPS